MYEAKQHKDKVIRRIDDGRVRQCVKTDSYNKKKSNLYILLTIQKMGRMKTRSQDAGFRPHSIPKDYIRHSSYPHVWRKDVGNDIVLMWDNPIQTITINTEGNRENDKKNLPTQTNFVWHHCELDYQSGTKCEIQLVPSIQHQSIHHIGAIEQFRRWPE